MNPLLMCRNFKSVEWHQKHTTKSRDTITLNYVFWCTLLTAFNFTVLYYFSSGIFFQWSLEFFLFLMYFFGLFRNRSVCFGCFETGPKHGNKPKKIVIGFEKWTETDWVSVLFQFKPKKICMFRGHPTADQSPNNTSPWQFVPSIFVTMRPQDQTSPLILW
jgi:hypothetical protein